MCSKMMVAILLLVYLFGKGTIAYNYFEITVVCFTIIPVAIVQCTFVFVRHNVCVGVVLMFQPKYKVEYTPEFQDSTLDTCEMVSKGWGATTLVCVCVCVGREGVGNRVIKRQQYSQPLGYTSFSHSLRCYTSLPVFSMQLQCTQTRQLPSEVNT